MPERAVESGLSVGMRKVRLFCKCRQTLWLCTKDADWALQYLRDQLDAKGDKPVAPDDREPVASPRSETPSDVEEEWHEVFDESPAVAGVNVSTVNGKTAVRCGNHSDYSEIQWGVCDTDDSMGDASGADEVCD